MRINHNMSSINSNNMLKFKTKDVSKSMEKLASGLKINRGGDDASGLAVSEKMRAQIRGLNQAEKNIENGVSFIQATEGYLQETTDLVMRIRELSVQASNGIYTDEDRMQIQVEVSQLVDEIDRVAEHAEFNSLQMLTGNYSKPDQATEPNGANMFFHVGANMDQREEIYIEDMRAAALNISVKGDDATANLKSADTANNAIGTMDMALQKINKQRADLGAYQNRFELAQKGVANAAENLQAAESIIRDTDMASQMVEFVKDNILVQSSTAMLAQANARPQSVLQLLG